MRKMIAKVVNIFIRFFQKAAQVLQKPLFEKCGRNVKIGFRSYFSYSNISIGNDVYIGPNAHFLSSDNKIVIGNKVMFGPNVTIITGNHRFDVIGKYMADVHEKRQQDDKPVIIEDDVWIGANVTVLKGVTIGKGSIVGAGSLVTKSIPPYTICYNETRPILKSRWTSEEIRQHEDILSRKAES